MDFSLPPSHALPPQSSALDRAAKARSEDLAVKRAAAAKAAKILAEENYKKQEEEKRNTVAEIRTLEGTEQKNALGLALYPIVYRLQADKAGTIMSMIMELDVSTLLGYVIDPPSIRGVIAEAMHVISGSPNYPPSRPPPHTGPNPSSASITLDDVDPWSEGDRDNVEKDL